MTCSMCRASFCYVCGDRIQGYNHFQKLGCSLFNEATRPVPVPERQRPEAVVRLEEELHRNPAARQRVRSCPRCRQRNLKESRNNHIKCWSCKTNFCYACLKTIDGTVSAHYSGKNMCPQHSD
jgi:E3 ubiquitin-protein ligase RNF14